MGVFAVRFVPFRHAHLVAATIAASALLSGCDKLDLSTPAQHIAKARADLVARNPKAAEIELKNALQKEPKNAAARLLLAEAYIAMQRGQGAEVELDHAEQFGATPASTLLLRARAYAVQRQYGRVLKTLPPTLTGSPEQIADLSEVRGDAQIASGQFAEADVSYDAALAVHPDSINALYGKARIAASHGDLAGARQLIERGLAISPKSVAGMLLKGDILYAQKDGDGANQQYAAAVATAPGDDTARIAYGSSLVRDGKYELADEQISTVLKRAPNNAPGNYLRAVMQFAQGHFKEASGSVQKVAAVAPDYLPAILLTASIQYQTGALLQAEANAQRYVKAVPGWLPGRKLLAAIYLKEAKAADAIATLEPLLSQPAFDDPQVFALAGAAMGQLGNAAQAVEYLSKATTLNPQDVKINTAFGVGNMVHGDVDRAIGAFETVLKVDSKNTDTDTMLMLGYMSKKEFGKGIELGQRLTAADPKNPTFFNLLGGAYAGNGDIDRARAAYEEAIRLGPALAPAAMNLARMEMDAKHPEAARKWLRMVADRNPKNVVVLHALADLDFAAGHEEAGGQWLELAGRENPESVPAQVRLASYYLQKQDYRRALSVARGAEAREPNNVGLLFVLAHAQAQNGERSAAVSTYERLASLKPDLPEIQVEIGRIEAADGHVTAARVALGKALAMKPGLISAQITLAELETRLGRYDAAAKIVTQLDRQPGASPANLLLAGDIAMGRRRYDAAIKAYGDAFAMKKDSLVATKLHAAMTQGGKVREADATLQTWMDANPKDVESRLYAAGAAALTRNTRRATELYLQVVALDPGQVGAFNELALLASIDESPRALEFAERAYALQPASGSIADTLGWILVERGDVERGAKILEKAVDVAPGNTEARYHLALALIRTGNKPAARANLKQIVAAADGTAFRDESIRLLREL